MRKSTLFLFLICYAVFLIIGCTSSNSPSLRSSTNLTIIGLGDSITAGVTATHPYLYYLQDRYPNHTFIVKAFGGGTTVGAIERYQDTVTDLHPGIVIFMIGTNDIYYNLPITSAMNNVAQMVQMAKDNGTVPIIVTQPPRADFNEKQNEQLLELNSLYRNYAAENNIKLVDAYPVFYDPEFPITHGLNRSVSIDGIHPNDTGTVVLAGIIEKCLR